MFYSMTGFGRAQKSSENYDVDIQIRSVNHRFLNASFKMPNNLLELELDLRQLVKKQISRGSVAVYVNVTDKNKNISNFLDVEYLRDVVEATRAVGRELQIKDDLDWQTIFNLNSRNNTVDTLTEEKKQLVLDTLREALDKICKYKMQEGKELEVDISKNLEIIEKEVACMEELADTATEKQMDILRQRLSSYLEKNSVNQERLEQELVLISDRIDISEELTRLKAHIKLYRHKIETEKFPGQSINFLTQELHREANTISSKTNLTEISHKAVFVKELIEKIREQVQNVE